MKSYYESLRDFNTMLQSLCVRPAMYVGTRDFGKAVVFLMGYDAGRLDAAHDILGPRAPRRSFLRGFRNHMDNKQQGLNPQLGWHSHIEMWADERGVDPFALLATKFEEFLVDSTPPLVQLAQQAE